MSKEMTRREFLASTAAVGAVHIVPRHVLGGPGFVPPSEKVRLAHIGCGSQGIRELPRILQHPEIQVTTVCDPNRDSMNYIDWSKEELKWIIRGFRDEPTWRVDVPGIPGGRDVMKEAIDKYYARERASEGYKGVTAYADFRELLEKEEFDAVKIITPDHLHATIAVACMRKGKHVTVHKPLANRMNESKLVIGTARQTGVTTYFLPWASNGPMDQIMKWIDGGLIGTLREIHNWSRRPVWPQYLELPTDQPPVPEGFDWDLWLGPEKPRPYHPHYTNNVFRGWYDFGGGSISDMGHYSLWGVVNALELAPPISAEATASHAIRIEEQVCRKIENDFSYPLACTIRFGFAPAAGRAPIDIVWHDGGMRPPTPDELTEDGEEFGDEGMLFVGDAGKILADFHATNPRLLPRKKMEAVMGPQPDSPPRRQRPEGPDPFDNWITACKTGSQPTGNFIEAETISEMCNLGAVALRAKTKVLYDTASMKITNVPDANKYLTRDYREGWELV